MPFGSSHGWGVAGSYLTAELAKLPRLDGVTLHCVKGHDFKPFEEDAWDRINIGYCFFEHDLLAAPFMAEAAQRWHHIVAGSSWCEQQLRKGGVEQTSTILQGVDRSRFAYQPPRSDDGRFIVFSGGKFEFRKGQDLVLAAMKTFMQRHPDVWLSCSWHNHWPQSLITMEQSHLIDFAWREEPCHQLLLETVCRNGLDPNRVLLHPPLDNPRMPLIYAESDIGLFPNRCEGGNNLVMCEYMACGRTVIASDRTGQADVLSVNNAFCLTRYQPVVATINGHATGNWQEPSPDELLELLEQAYRERDLLKAKGSVAAQEMARLSWESAAQRFHALGMQLAACMSSVQEPSAQALAVADQYFDDGCYGEARACYADLLKKNPFSAELHNRLGTVLDRLQFFPQAIAHYHKALALHERFDVARFNLSNSLAHVGEWEAAIREMRAVVCSQPDFTEAWQNLAYLQYHQGDCDAAIACLDRVTALAPGLSEPHCELARIYLEQGNHQQALAHCDKLLQRQPGHRDALLIRFQAFKRLGKGDAAVASLLHLLEIEPDDPTIWIDLSDLYLSLAKAEDARACLEQAVARIPHDPNLLNALGAVLHELHDLDGAETMYAAALALDPGSVEVCNNKGNLCKSLLRMGEAIDWYDHALERDPENPTVLFNRSLALLAQGRFLEGWPDFEQRFDCTLPARLHHPEIPRWQGEDLHGRRLLIQSEQVYGDTLMFCRYIEKTLQYNGPVVFECQDNTIRQALGAFEGKVERLLVRGEPLPDIAVQVPLLSLPGLFKTTLESVPSPAGYLVADSTRMSCWGSIIPHFQETMNIGLVWGGRKAPLNADRSLQLQEIEPLFSMAGTRYFSLQLGEDARQLEPYRNMITDLGPYLINFGETAAVISNLDLVITIDTAIAHLAGALGLPVWVLLKYSPDWRWLLERSDSPWYGSAYLFRQQCHRSSWRPVVQAVQEKLAVVLANRKKTVKVVNV